MNFSKKDNEVKNLSYSKSINLAKEVGSFSDSDDIRSVEFWLDSSFAYS